MSLENLRENAKSSGQIGENFAEKNTKVTVRKRLPPSTPPRLVIPLHSSPDEHHPLKIKDPPPNADPDFPKKRTTENEAPGLEPARPPPESTHKFRKPNRNALTT
jgi:hypothetical protein